MLLFLSIIVFKLLFLVRESAIEMTSLSLSPHASKFTLTSEVESACAKAIYIVPG